MKTIDKVITDYSVQILAPFCCLSEVFDPINQIYFIVRAILNSVKPAFRKKLRSNNRYLTLDMVFSH